MVSKDPQTVSQHFGTTPLADFKLLVSGESFQRAADPKPGNDENSQSHDQRACDRNFFLSSARGNQNGKKAHLRDEAYDSSPRRRQEQGADREQCEKSYERQLIAPLRAQNLDRETRGNEQFHQSRKMVPIDVRAKRDAAVAKFAQPIQFSVKCEVLQDSK